MATADPLDVTEGPGGDDTVTLGTDSLGPDTLGTVLAATLSRPHDSWDRVRVHAAVLDLLAQGGGSACTMDALSSELHMSKATLYRRWPDKAAIIRDTLHATAPTSSATSSAHDKPEELLLVTELRALDGALHGPWGQAVRALAVDIDRSKTLRVLRDAFFDARTARITCSVAAGSPSAVRLAVSVPVAGWARGAPPMNEDDIRDLADDVEAVSAIERRG